MLKLLLLLMASFLHVGRQLVFQKRLNMDMSEDLYSHVCAMPRCPVYLPCILQPVSHISCGHAHLPALHDPSTHHALR
jgi:hypothetical protein